ncbi:hypothetical protein GII33_16170 [Gordonia pseudamarae]|uniref:Uncharacterized protein n=1 Tax=Gordonia pseudamarae TaxID=2831662 RepID=A0ABX6ILB0_9ACTN|nr:hypothetical protein [Gordonia pseudamarae]QHN27258.1 hypothetical protein GII33_16170 [Gordonia pseudamarae]QHN36141.1 hypothetical protein GII31_15945 [Gordonia pseudamarae]
MEGDNDPDDADRRSNAREENESGAAPIGVADDQSRLRLAVLARKRGYCSGSNETGPSTTPSPAESRHAWTSRS